MKSSACDDKRLSCDEDGSGYMLGRKAVRRRDAEPFAIRSAKEHDDVASESLRAGIMGKGW